MISSIEEKVLIEQGTGFTASGVRVDRIIP